MTESEIVTNRNIPESKPTKPRRDHTRVIGDMYKGNVQADFAEAGLEAGLGTEEKPFPTVVLQHKDEETGEDIPVQRSGIVVELPYNGIRRELAVVDPQGVLRIVRFSEDDPTILQAGGEASLRIYADDAVQQAVRDAIQHVANPDLATEEY